MNNFDFRSYILQNVLPYSGLKSLQALAAKYNVEYGHKGLTRKNVTNWLQGLALNCEYNTFDVVTMLGYEWEEIGEDTVTDIDSFYWSQMGEATLGLIELVNNEGELRHKVYNFELLVECEAEVTKLYDNLLDESYADACEGLPVVVTGSRLLKDYDETAYRCGLIDYADSLELDAFTEYCDIVASWNELESELNDANLIIDESKV